MNVLLNGREEPHLEEMQNSMIATPPLQEKEEPTTDLVGAEQLHKVIRKYSDIFSEHPSLMFMKGH